MKTGKLFLIIFCTETCEFINRLASKNSKFIVQQLKLRDKRTGALREFPLFKENDISHISGSAVVTNFDMSKLEVEYDYDTDVEQLGNSRYMLLRELKQAVEFYITDDPLKLVDNLRIRGTTA